MSENPGENIKKIFDNPGKKIKKMATILFWLGTVSYVILAFACGWTDESYQSYYGGWEHYTKFHPEYFFPLIIAGPLFSYVSSLCLAGFADLIEKINVLAKGSETDNVVKYH